MLVCKYTRQLVQSNFKIPDLFPRKKKKTPHVISRRRAHELKIWVIRFDSVISTQVCLHFNSNLRDFYIADEIIENEKYPSTLQIACRYKLAESFGVIKNRPERVYLRDAAYRRVRESVIRALRFLLLCGRDYIILVYRIVGHAK